MSENSPWRSLIANTVTTGLGTGNTGKKPGNAHPLVNSIKRAKNNRHSNSVTVFQVSKILFPYGCAEHRHDAAIYGPHFTGLTYATATTPGDPRTYVTELTLG